MHILDVLKERGFVAQVTYEEDLYKLFDKGPVTFYVGIDMTADSLHVGHYVPVMAMAHLQRAGHRPIALLGGATTMIGDPSGKTELRPMLTREQIDHNAQAIKKQLEHVLDLSDGKGLIVNNADWLLKLNYVEFLRDVGVHFSVNRMLTAECYKQRLERGLTFLEFNYMLMQSYDFLELFRQHGCRLQIGGDDQWSNILAGADLIRRKEREEAFALTFNLLLNHEGKKMGKTEKGALWLDPNRVSPYEFYQYWRNVADEDVEKCLALWTFLPMDEVRRLGALKGAESNEAKAILAYECTRIIHGDKAADDAKASAESLFAGVGEADAPEATISAKELAEDNRLSTLVFVAGLATSRSEARTFIKQGAISVNDERVTDIDERFEADAFGTDGLLIRRGKKRYCRLVLKP